MKQEECREREKMYACWLCNFPGIRNAQMHRLSELCGGPEGIYHAGREQWAQVLTLKQVESLADYTEKWPPEARYREMREEGIELVTFADMDYPERLRNIPDAPFALFVRGHLPKDEPPAIAVIGARECSEYGRFVARELGMALARQGVVVVSGMAKGIDGISQEAALEAGGVSVAVLGSGVDVCYPAQNRNLYSRLLQRGAVLSAYPVGTPARPQNFPPRNRIVSGLADAVVVVEARARSGTLITVDMALEQGREVYVVPGRVTDRLSDGCNRLIRQGAGVCLSPESFFEEILQLRENRKEIKTKRKIHHENSPESSEEPGRRGNLGEPGRRGNLGEPGRRGNLGEPGRAGNSGEPVRIRTSVRTGNPGKPGSTRRSGEGMTGLLEKRLADLPEDLARVCRVLDFTPRTAEEIGKLLPEGYQDRQLIPCLMQLCMAELAIQVSPGQFCLNGGREHRK